MDKTSFISEIKPILKKMNYRKNGNYWYKLVDGHICCVNVEGSQWNKHNYYVTIGFSYYNPEHKNPTILQWYCRHRCQGANGELNILPEELLEIIEDVFDSVSTTEQVPDFLKQRNAVKVVSQFWF